MNIVFLEKSRETMGGRKERKCNMLKKYNLSGLMITSENPYLFKCSLIRFFFKEEKPKF